MSEQLAFKTPVRLATTANITLSGEQTIDGETTSDDRVLVKDQSDTTENGIYVSSSGHRHRRRAAMTRQIGRKGLDLIKRFESFVPYVYDDLVPPLRGRYREWDGGLVRGTLTIGYGHTDAARYPLKIAQGLRLSEIKALEILKIDLDECEEAVNALVSVPLTQGRFDALVSFAFNCGIANLKKLIVPLNRGDYDVCRRKFDLFVRSKGQVLRGLQRRRAAEQALWDDRYEDVAVPDKPVPHPAEVAAPKPKPMSKSTIGNGAGVGGSLTLGGIVATIWEKFTAAPGTVQEAVVQAAQKPAFWFTLAAALTFAFIWWRRKRMQEAA